jgi:hypothetical protein
MLGNQALTYGSQERDGLARGLHDEVKTWETEMQISLQDEASSQLVGGKRGAAAGAGRTAPTFAKVEEVQEVQGDALKGRFKG